MLVGASGNGNKCYLCLRYATVQRALTKDIHTIFSYEEHTDGAMFGLVIQDLTQIKPNYESMSKIGALRITEDGYAQGNLNRYMPAIICYFCL